jgi:hypothetical protein
MTERLDFLGIGAPRSGTTWLYDRLMEHPGFQLPQVKELHYFDRSPEYPSPNFLAAEQVKERFKDSTWRWQALSACAKSFIKVNFSELRWNLKWYFSYYDDEWYVSLFERMDGIRGEISPAYMLLKDEDVARIYALVPNIKTIFLMRDPIQRTWSSYRKNFLKQGKMLPDDKSIIEYLESPAIVQRVNYIEAIERYQKYSQPGRMLISFLDAIEENPLETLQEITTFLGGNLEKIPEYCSIRTVSNASPSLNIPERIEDYLCAKYHPLITELAERFGGYCTRWFNRYYGTNMATAPMRTTLILE